MTVQSVSDRAGPAQPTAVLSTEGLRWRVGGFEIIRGIDLDIHDGEFLSVIGPNGAGKSSLINLLSGVHSASDGRIFTSGEDITTLRPADRTRRGIGRTFQTSSLFPGLTVLENARLAAQAALGGSLDLVRRPKGNDLATTTAMDRITEVGLADRADQPVTDLPHGDKRKLEIAIVLCTEPKVLLLDEPTAGVSAEEVGPLVDVVRDVHGRGRTVVMVEHRMEIVLDVSDRIAVVHRGELLACDVPDVVVADERVRDAYLGAEL